MNDDNDDDSIMEKGLFLDKHIKDRDSKGWDGKEFKFPLAPRSNIAIAPENEIHTPRKDRDEHAIEAARRVNNQYRDYCWHNAIKPLLLFVATTGALVVCAMFCLPCLFGVFIFSACLCPFIPVMNIPLWATIVILLWNGWTLTTGNIMMSWGYRN